jgi:hypothetical protein
MTLPLHLPERETQVVIAGLRGKGGSKKELAEACYAVAGYAMLKCPEPIPGQPRPKTGVPGPLVADWLEKALLFQTKGQGAGFSIDWSTVLPLLFEIISDIVLGHP